MGSLLSVALILFRSRDVIECHVCYMDGWSSCGASENKPGGLACFWQRLTGSLEWLGDAAPYSVVSPGVASLYPIL